MHAISNCKYVYFFIEFFECPQMCPHELEGNLSCKSRIVGPLLYGLRRLNLFS